MDQPPVLQYRPGMKLAEPSSDLLVLGSGRERRAGGMSRVRKVVACRPGWRTRKILDGILTRANGHWLGPETAGAKAVVVFHSEYERRNAPIPG